MLIIILYELKTVKGGISVKIVEVRGKFESLIFVSISYVNVFTPVNTRIEHSLGISFNKQQTIDFTVTV